MRVITLKSEVKLTQEQQKKVKWQLGNLKGLIRMLRVEPLRWTQDGKEECSLLGELEACKSIAEDLLAGRAEGNVDATYSRLDVRYEAAARCTFGYLKFRGSIGEQAEREQWDPEADAANGDWVWDPVEERWVPLGDDESGEEADEEE